MGGGPKRRRQRLPERREGHCRGGWGPGWGWVPPFIGLNGCLKGRSGLHTAAPLQNSLAHLEKAAPGGGPETRCIEQGPEDTVESCRLRFWNPSCKSHQGLVHQTA